MIIKCCYYSTLQRSNPAFDLGSALTALNTWTINHLSETGTELAGTLNADQMHTLSIWHLGGRLFLTVVMCPILRARVDPLERMAPLDPWWVVLSPYTIPFLSPVAQSNSSLSNAMLFTPWVTLNVWSVVRKILMKNLVISLCVSHLRLCP